MGNGAYGGSPEHPKLITAVPMNAMPWKGHTLLTDWNSGLWVIKLEPKAEPATP